MTAALMVGFVLALLLVVMRSAPVTGTSGGNVQSGPSKATIAPPSKPTSEALAKEQAIPSATVELKNDPPSKVTLTAVITTPVIPTTTPTPHLLKDLVQQADTVAQVEVSASYSGSKVLRVTRYFKNGGWSYESDGENPYETPFIRVVGSNYDLKPLAYGESLIIFLTKATHSWCSFDAARSVPYMLIGGKESIYMLRHGKVRRLGDEDGMSAKDLPLDYFISQVEALVGEQKPANPYVVDNGPDQLVRLAHTADAIAEVEFFQGDAGVGRVVLRFAVKEWIKSSPVFAEDNIRLDFGTCETMPQYSDAGRHILFLHKEKLQNEAGGPSEWTYLTGGYDGIFAISKVDTILDAGLGHYVGWKLAEFKAEIRNALSTPGTPDLVLRPKP